MDFQATLEDLDCTLQQLHARVEAVILGNTAEAKKDAAAAAKPVVKEARAKLSALRAEARRAGTPEEKAQYTAICNERGEQIRTYEVEMNGQIYQQAPLSTARTYEERKAEELMGPGGADGTGFTESKQVLQAAVRVQQDAIESLQRTERLQHVTEQTGQTTLVTLQQQRELGYQINEELENVQGLLDHAARDVRWFYRQLAGDKCFLSLLGICVVALIVLVFVSVYTKRS